MDEHNNDKPVQDDESFKALKVTPLGKRRRILIVVTAIFYVPIAIWLIGALRFDLPFNSTANGVAAILWACCAGFIPLIWRRRGLGLWICAAAAALILAWWLSIRPRLDRDWQSEYSRLPIVERYGDRVTIKNVRDFDHSVPGEFKERYVDRVYDMKNLADVDLFLCYWGHEYIAHPFISFNFGPDGRLAISVETRREKGEGYSTLGGLYKMFELIYIAGTERDFVLKRVMNGEDVYLYQSSLSLGAARQLFLEYVERMSELAEHPEFYGVLGANCTTSVRAQRKRGERAPWDWRLLANGKLDELLYERGELDNSKPFEEVKREALINDDARQNKDATDFSKRIRMNR